MLIDELMSCFTAEISGERKDVCPICKYSPNIVYMFYFECLFFCFGIIYELLIQACAEFFSSESVSNQTFPPSVSVCPSSPLSGSARGRWYKFNDNVVEEFDMNDETLEYECFGGEYRPKVYDQCKSRYVDI